MQNLVFILKSENLDRRVALKVENRTDYLVTGVPKVTLSEIGKSTARLKDVLFAKFGRDAVIA